MDLDTYGKLELLGHVTIFGHLSEEEVAGVPMIRVDVFKNSEQVETRYYGTGAVYCITPMDEQAVLEATRTPVRRINPYVDVAEVDDYDEPNL